MKILSLLLNGSRGELMEYTNNYDLDIIPDDPCYNLLKNNIKYEEGNKNDYNCCDYKFKIIYK